MKNKIFSYYLGCVILGIVILTGCGTVQDLTTDNNNPQKTTSNPAYYNLTINIVGQGSVTINPVTTNGKYEAGTQLVIIPIPDSADGWAFFNNWEGDVTTNYYTINKDTAATVNFTKII
jgi:hypothetical protein